MGWKNWPYWLRGGIIGIVIPFIILILGNLILRDSKYEYIIYILALVFPLMFVESIEYIFPYPLSEIIIFSSILIYFIVGALIGWIFGKELVIKIKENKSLSTKAIPDNTPPMINLKKTVPIRIGSKRIIILSLVLILIILSLFIYINFFNQKECTNFECFQQEVGKCDPGSYYSFEEEDFHWKYIIEKSEGDCNCVISVAVSNEILGTVTNTGCVYVNNCAKIDKDFLNNLKNCEKSLKDQVKSMAND